MQPDVEAGSTGEDTSSADDEETSLEGELRRFASDPSTSIKALEEIERAHASGQDVFPRIERMTAASAPLSAFIFLLSQKGVPVFIEGLDLEEEEKARLISLYGDYEARLGRLAGSFWKRSAEGTQDVIDYVDIFPLYDRRHALFLFNFAWYSGDRIAHQGTDKASSLLWLTERIVLAIASEISGGSGLPLDEDETSVIRNRSEAIRTQIDGLLSSITERLDAAGERSAEARQGD